MNAYIGEIAALATSLCWTATSVFFAFASRNVGSVILNRARLVFALLFLIAAHLLLRIPLPVGVERTRWFWLALSGVVGLTLGDMFLFQTYIWIGPRLGMLMMSLAPIIAGIAAWLFLDEQLVGIQILGILVTIGGVGWVVLDGRGSNGNGGAHTKHYWKGILFGIAAASGQAFGLILAKKGLGDNFPAITATLMRMLAATATIWALTFLQRQARLTVERLSQERSTLPYILLGVLSGPVLGVTLSLLAIQNSQVGVASTLMALPPVFLLPVGYLVFQERFGWGAVVGTLVAIAGVGLLFMA